jgi:S1-C subfamily serine protease
MSALGKDSILVSIPQRTTYYANGDRPADVVNAAITHAARLFAEEEGLQERLGTHYGTSIALSKGGEVVLSTPPPIAFNSRREMIPALVKAVVTIQTDAGHGSGFMVSSDGYLITNEHVVGKESIVRVKFEQGFTLDAQVMKVNKDFDLALVKVQATDLPALTIGDDSILMLGEELFAIGTPLDATLGQSVSRGVLSGRRELDGRSYLQTDVSINPGNSGGPFIDVDGKVVGVATMKISGKGLEGLGFGVPISVALEMLNIRMAQ